MTNPLVLGDTFWNPAVNYGQTVSGTVVLHAVVETTLNTNGVLVKLLQFTGAGAPASIAVTTVSLSTTAVHVTVNLPTFAAGTAISAIYQVLLYLQTNDGTTYATCSGAWLEITP